MASESFGYEPDFEPRPFGEGVEAPQGLGDPKLVKEAAKAAKDAADVRRAMIEAIMSMKQGRDWLSTVIYGMCHVNLNAMASDPLHTAFLLGEQNIGQRLIAEVSSACPEQFTLMLKESTNG